MDKKIFIISILFLSLLIGSVSAANFDNQIRYDKGSNGNQDLKVNFKNWFGLGTDYGSAELKSHSSVEEIRQVGLGKQVVMWYDFKFNELYKNGLGDVQFIDMNLMEEVEKDYSFVYWGTEEYEVENYVRKVLSNGSEIFEEDGVLTRTRELWLPYDSKDIPEGDVTIGVKINMGMEETIDLIWNLAGKKIKRHAVVTSGSVQTIDGLYTVETYINDGTFNITSNLEADILVVAGGGAGGTSGGGGSTGGGGAGGYNLTLAKIIPTGNYFITVGDGGAIGNNGEDSSLGTIVTATGGGAGGDSASSNGDDGGSGGGGYGTLPAGSFGGTKIGIGTGNNGGDGTIGPNFAAGGGGGASGVGGNGNPTGNAGNGGAGLQTNINGTLFYYSAGGGGSVGVGGTGGIGGSGIGGTGATGGGSATGGATNRGAGGGGVQTGNAGLGGSGIVIIRYIIPVSSLLISSVSPVNNTNFTISSPTLTWNVTPSDGGIAIANSTMNITFHNGTLAYSSFNNSGIVGFYEATPTLADSNNYSWNAYAFGNNSGFYTSSNGTLFFSIDTMPKITVDNPINATNFSVSTIYFNATSSLGIDTWNIDYNGTNVSVAGAGTLLNQSLDVEDGFHHLRVYGNSSVTLVMGLNDSIYFMVDATAPTMNISSPTGIYDLLYDDYNLTLIANSTDAHLDKCWYEYEGVNVTFACSSMVDATDYFNYSVGENEITVWANDTFGHVNSTSATWAYTILENSQTFNNETFEGTVETLVANVTVETSSTVVITNLFYNGTSYPGSFSPSGNETILTIDFTIPSVDVDTNFTFIWNIILADGQSINLTSNNQSIFFIGLDNCLVNTVALYNYTMVDEGNQSELSNTLMEINLDLWDIGRTEHIANFTNISSSINPFAVCLNKNIGSSTYLVDSIVRYQATAYSIEYYNIVSSTLTNSTIPINITLYDLALLDATEFKITFKDENFLFVENALIYIDRQYISESNSFKTVELPKTDSNGQTIGHFVRNDVVYNIRVLKDGIVLGSFSNIIAFCTDFTIGDCQIILEATPTGLISFDYDEQLGITYQSIPTYNNATNAVSFSFLTDDGTPKTVFMEVTRSDIFGNRTLCNHSLTSASGTLSCSIDPNIEDTVLRTRIYVNNQLAVLGNVKLEDSAYGTMGYILWFFLTFLFIFLFGSSKTEVLIGLVISLMGAITLGVTKGDIIGIGSAGIWVLVIAILGIWKINKENPQ